MTELEMKYDMALKNISEFTDLLFSMAVENIELKRLLEEMEDVGKEDIGDTAPKQAENNSGGIGKPYFGP